jgi:hypothetical protein
MKKACESLVESNKSPVLMRVSAKKRASKLTGRQFEKTGRPKKITGDDGLHLRAEPEDDEPTPYTPIIPFADQRNCGAAAS